MRYLVGANDFGPYSTVSVGEDDGPVRLVAPLGQLVEFWKAGHQVAKAVEPPADFVISHHDKVERVIPDEPSGPTDMDAAVPEIYAIKKQLAEIVSGMAPGSSLTISISKERR